MKRGIVAGGNWIVDHVKMIDRYPQEKTLANIRFEALSNGGAPYNVLKALSKLGGNIPLYGVGLLGEDELGDWILKDCRELRINTDLLKKEKKLKTSFTDVMTVEENGVRTFFHYRGANSILKVEDFNFSKLSGKIFYLGYLLLLDDLDKSYPDGSTGASMVLKNARRAGFKTAVDLVSEDSNRFREIVLPSLPFINYLFLNEFEASKLSGIILSDTNPNFSRYERAADEFFKKGLLNWAFIHLKNGIFGKGRDGKVVKVGALKVPTEEIRSTVGAGDACAAGILYGIHEDWTIERAMELGVCAAASSLLHVSCSEGILHVDKALKLGKLYGMRKIN